MVATATRRSASSTPASGLGEFQGQIRHLNAGTSLGRRARATKVKSADGNNGLGGDLVKFWWVRADLSPSATNDAQSVAACVQVEDDLSLGTFEPEIRHRGADHDTCLFSCDEPMPRALAIRSDLSV